MTKNKNKTKNAVKKTTTNMMTVKKEKTNHKNKKQS